MFKLLGDNREEKNVDETKLKEVTLYLMKYSIPIDKRRKLGRHSLGRTTLHSSRDIEFLQLSVLLTNSSSYIATIADVELSSLVFVLPNQSLEKP